MLLSCSSNSSPKRRDEEYIPSLGTTLPFPVLSGVGAFDKIPGRFWSEFVILRSLPGPWTLDHQRSTEPATTILLSATKLCTTVLERKGTLAGIGGKPVMYLFTGEKEEEEGSGGLG